MPTLNVYKIVMENVKKFQQQNHLFNLILKFIFVKHLFIMDPEKYLLNY